MPHGKVPIRHVSVDVLPSINHNTFIKCTQLWSRIHTVSLLRKIISLFSNCVRLFLTITFLLSVYMWVYMYEFIYTLPYINIYWQHNLPELPVSLPAAWWCNFNADRPYLLLFCMLFSCKSACFEINRYKFYPLFWWHKWLCFGGGWGGGHFMNW